jgi:hypothetical protein
VICPTDFDVDIDLTYTLDNKGGVEHEEIAGRCRWTFKDPILQGQGFFLKWSRREKANGESMSSSAHVVTPVPEPTV